MRRAIAILILALVVAWASTVLWGCSACDGGSGGTGIDGGTDTGSDADAETDTDSLVYDGGPLIDCPGQPEPGEVCIPGGTYLMGCMPYDTWCEDNEKPMVEVTLSPFWIDKREATYGHVLAWLNSLDDSYQKTKTEYSVFDADGGLLWGSETWGGGPPICYDADAGEFQWEQGCDGGCGGPLEAAAGGFWTLGAKLFCEYWGKRLPTEAEWEAAARGQTKLIWPCDWEHKPCWHGAYAMCYEGDECYGEICCSPWLDEWCGDCESPDGVRGMYGNAWEWVLDGLDEDHSWCADGCTDPPPRPTNDEDQWVAKGGCISTDARLTRISARAGLGTATAKTGVRCVRSPISFEDVAADGGD